MMSLGEGGVGVVLEHGGEKWVSFGLLSSGTHSTHKKLIKSRLDLKIPYEAYKLNINNNTFPRSQIFFLLGLKKIEKMGRKKLPPHQY